MTFEPKLLTTLRGYTRAQALSDVTAGVIVGIVALPLAIAFAIASGVTPERGLWTAIIAGLLISALGGSRVQIGGPTGAFVVIVYAIVTKHGVDGLLVATLMAGVILVIMGFAGLGSAIKFIPHPVITGFTSGIAVIILSSQVKDLLGLRMGAVPPEFLAKWRAYGHSLPTANASAVALSALALLIILLWGRVSRRIPAPFVALLVTSAVAAMLDLPVETIGSRFGAIDAAFPTPALPDTSWETLRALAGPAFTIAMLGAVESLLSAVVADGMIGGRHRSNTELIAQGIANIVTPIFGGIPATGAIARTATNIRNGGRTPVAGMVHALTLLAITLFAGRWAARIPMATLAAILVVVAYGMSEWRTFRAELRSPRSDVAVLLATFTLTVLVDLTVAIGVGTVLASFLFIRRMSEVTRVTAIGTPTEEGADRGDSEDATVRSLPDGVAVYEVSGPVFFGAAEVLTETLTRGDRSPRVLIIQMREVPAIDSTGIRVLHDAVRRASRDGTRVMLAEVRAQPLAALRRAGVLEEIGADRVFTRLDEAIAAARAP